MATEHRKREMVHEGDTGQAACCRSDGVAGRTRDERVSLARPNGELQVRHLPTVWAWPPVLCASAAVAVAVRKGRSRAHVETPTRTTRLHQPGRDASSCH